jgi:signal transduction histidine kinase
VEAHPGSEPGGTREQRLERLIEVGRALVSELDLEAVLERVLDAAQELTGAQYAALGVLDESRSELERFLTRGIDAETHRAIGDLPRGRGVLGVLITDPRPLRLTDVGEHSRSFGFPLGHPPMHSFLGVPILIHGHAYGNLYLTEKQSGEFDEEDENALVILADWAAIAIENARAYSDVAGRQNELERAVATLEATTEIGRALAGETDLERILELVVKRGRALTDARAALVMLESGGELVLTSLAGELDLSLIGQRIPVEGTVAGQVLRAGRAERLADARGRLRFALARETHADTGLFVPLLFRGRALGVLAAFDRLRDGPEFSAWDEHILTGFAASAAAGIATAQGANAQALRRSIAAAEQERTRWARDLHDETLQELAALKLLLGAARRTENPGERDSALDEAAERIDVAVRALRSLITDLRPAVLDEYGLEPALEALAERVKQVSGTSVDLRIQLEYDAGREPGRLAQQIEDALYRVVQEALSNVTKHSGATHAEVLVRESEETIEVVVRDEGTGFDADAESTGFGLLGMRERVALVDGGLTIESSPGTGTQIRVSLPIRRAEPPLRQARTAEG